MNVLHEALSWALQQEVTLADENGTDYIAGKYTKDTQGLVDKVREYFDNNGIDYPPMSFDTLKPYFDK